MSEQKNDSIKMIESFYMSPVRKSKSYFQQLITWKENFHGRQ